MEAALPIEVVERRPWTEYRGTVYEWGAVVATTDSEFEVFDLNSLVTPEMTGTSREVDLLVWCSSDAVPLSGERYGIEPIADDWHLTVRGEMGRMDPDARSALLDVGDGTVRIKIDELPDSAVEGSFVEIRDAAPYLYGVEGDRSSGETYEFFLARLRSEDPDVRAEAAEFLGTKGSERCLDALISTLKDDPAPSVRRAAAEALGRIGASAYEPDVKPESSIEASLRGALEDDAEEVQEEARDALDFIAEWWN